MCKFFSEKSIEKIANYPNKNNYIPITPINTAKIEEFLG